ncbi:MAG: hypothetical protein V1820_00830 [archaeon]
MKKSLGFLPRILSGAKTIESRWYSTRRAPFGKISAGESVYFKNSGEPVTVRAEVSKVIEFEDISPENVRSILSEYGKGIGLSEKEIPFFEKSVSGKKYCVLIFLEAVRPCPPFGVDKTGFGTMSAWISAEKLKKTGRQ